MVDNTPFLASTDPASPKIADDEIAYSGDNAKVQIVQLAIVTGAEGAHSMTKLGDFSATLTSILNRLPAALGGGGGLRDEAVERVLTASVAIAGNLSAELDLTGLRNWGFIVPSTFDGSLINFQMSDISAGTYIPVYDITNTLVQMTVTAGRYYDIPGELMGIRFLKINCVTAQATTTTVFTIVGKS